MSGVETIGDLIDLVDSLEHNAGAKTALRDAYERFRKGRRRGLSDREVMNEWRQQPVSSALLTKCLL